MPRTICTTEADVGEVSIIAESFGYDHNGLIELLVKDRILPFYESHSFTVELSEVNSNAYGWSEDLVAIFKACLTEWNLKRFDLIN